METETERRAIDEPGVTETLERTMRRQRPLVQWPLLLLNGFSGPAYFPSVSALALRHLPKQLESHPWRPAH
jgi:hypothetical protein